MKFNCLKHFPDFPSHYVEEAEKRSYSTQGVTELFVRNSLTAFSGFSRCNFILNLQKQFKLSKNIGNYFKFPARCGYDWHVDLGVRKCALNWLVKSDGNYLTLFRNRKDSTTSWYRTEGTLYYDFEVAEYELYKPTLLDVTYEHCVINHSNSERIIYTMDINAPFDEVNEYLMNLKVEKY